MDARHDVNPAEPSSGTDPSVPEVIPSLELTGSRADRVKALDAAIARLQDVRITLAGTPRSPVVPELHGPYLNAPVWPWFAAGWTLGALFVLLFFLAWRWA